MSAAPAEVGRRTASWWGPVGLPDVGGLRRAPEAWLVVVIWSTVVVSQVALSLSRPKAYTPITDGPRETAAWVETLTTGCDAILLLACAVAVLMRIRAIPWRTLPLLAALLAPWAVLLARSYQLDLGFGLGVLPYVAMAVAFWVLRPRQGVIELTGYLTALAAVLSILLALVLPDAGIYTGAEGSEDEKPIGPFGILAGFQPTGNNLGRALVLGLPAVLTIRSTVHRRVALGVTLVALVWTFSRTSWIATALVIGLVVLLRLIRHWREDSARLVAIVTGTAIGGLALVVAVLPFVVSDGTSFNNRASFWIFTLERWREQPLLGHGVDFFTRLADEPDNLGGFAYHAHNLAVQALVTGGVLLALCTALLLGLAAVRAVRQAREGADWAALFVVTVLVVSVLEVPVSFADNAKANVAALVPLLVLLCARTLVREGSGTDQDEDEDTEVRV